MDIDQETQIGVDGIRRTIDTGPTVYFKAPPSREDLIVMGLVPGHSIITKFGRNSDIDSGTLPEDIWENGGLYTGFSSAAQTLDVVSDSTNDTGAGSGAQTMKLVGLDSNFDEIEETITLTGEVVVVTTKLFIRFFRAIVLTAGGGGTNAGIITISQTTSGDVMGSIQTSQGQTNIGAFTVSNDKSGLLRRIRVGLAKSVAGPTTVRFEVCVRSFGGAWLSIRTFELSEGSDLGSEFITPILVSEKTDIVLRITEASGNDIRVDTSFDIELFDRGLVSPLGTNV